MRCYLFPNHKPPYNLRIRYPAYNDQTRPPGLTDDEFLNYAITRDGELGVIPAGSPVYIVEVSEAPSDHACDARCAFFDAWEWDDVKGVIVNMVKARSMLMDRIREVRDGELVKMDIPFMRAVETQDVPQQQRIAGLKQELRDIPQTFDLTQYTTPEALKLAWPTLLPNVPATSGPFFEGGD